MAVGRDRFQKVSGNYRHLQLFFSQAVRAVSLLRLTAPHRSGWFQPNPSLRLLQTWVFVRWPLLCPSWRRLLPEPRSLLLIIPNFAKSSSDFHLLPRIICFHCIYVKNPLSPSSQDRCVSLWFVLLLFGWRPAPRKYLARKSTFPFSMMKTSRKSSKLSGDSRILWFLIPPIPMPLPCTNNPGIQGEVSGSGPASGSMIPPATSGPRLRHETGRSTDGAGAPGLGCRPWLIGAEGRPGPQSDRPHCAVPGPPCLRC